MNENFVLQVYNDRLLDEEEVGQAVGVAYALRLQGVEFFEIEEFMGNPLHSTPRYKDTLNDIASRILNMTMDGIFNTMFFKAEDGYWALPKSGRELRLYVEIVNSQTAILGGGGIKNKGTRTIQESPILAPKRLIMRELKRRLDNELNDTIFTNPDFGGLYDSFGNLINTITLKSPR